MCPECRELCATERWCWYCGETLCWELKPEDAAWLDRMPGSDKGEHMNPDETGVSSKPTEKGNKMLWAKLDMNIAELRLLRIPRCSTGHIAAALLIQDGFPFTL